MQITSTHHLKDTDQLTEFKKKEDEINQPNKPQTR